MLSLLSRKPSAPTDTRQKWLLLYNCQGIGLANCLNLLNDEIHVEFYEPTAFRKHASDLRARMDAFSRILVAPQCEHLLPAGILNRETTWRIPTIFFNAYHPDICYLRSRGKSLKGPLGDYHSAIAFGAYRKGMDAKRIRELYTEDSFSKLGYFNYWDHSKNLLLGSFSEAGFDLSAKFVDWTRQGAFMYSNNHVRIHCLLDVARAILHRAGEAADYAETAPHDNLANGPVYPIYPEIGRRLGVDGSYLFKVGGEYRYIRMEEFLSLSIDLYASTRDVEVIPTHQKMLERTIAFLEKRA
jgi:hypothetical protein